MGRKPARRAKINHEKIELAKRELKMDQETEAKRVKIDPDVIVIEVRTLRESCNKSKFFSSWKGKMTQNRRAQSAARLFSPSQADFSFLAGEERHERRRSPRRGHAWPLPRVQSPIAS